MRSKQMVAAAVGLLCAVILPIAGASAAGWRLLSDQSIRGFAHPSSVACDIWQNFLYVSDYGPSAEPTAANDQGTIIKLSDQGRFLDRNYLKQPGGFHRPRGLVISGPNMWMGDLNTLWQFDVRRGGAISRKFPEISDIDSVVFGYTGQLYLSDTKADRVMFIGTSDTLNALRSQVIKPSVIAYAAGHIFPRAIAARQRGGLYLFGFNTSSKHNDLYLMPYDWEEQYLPTSLLPPKMHMQNVGTISATQYRSDDEMFMTDWKSGALLRWTKSGGFQTLASGFAAPSGMCIIPHPLRKPEMGFAVTDILKGELRILWFNTSAQDPR